MIEQISGDLLIYDEFIWWENQGKSQGPVVVLCGGHEGGLHLGMKTLDLAVGLLVVAGSPIAADAEEGHDLIPHVGLELTAAIRGEAEGDTELGDSRSDESLGDGVCGGQQWVRFRANV